MGFYLILSKGERHLASITSNFDPYFTKLRKGLRDSMLELIIGVALSEAGQVSRICRTANEVLLGDENAGLWRQNCLRSVIGRLFSNPIRMVNERCLLNLDKGQCTLLHGAKDLLRAFVTLTSRLINSPTRHERVISALARMTNEFTLIWTAPLLSFMHIANIIRVG